MSDSQNDVLGGIRISRAELEQVRSLLYKAKLALNFKDLQDTNTLINRVLDLTQDWALR